jgi:hypothetical protein
MESALGLEGSQASAGGHGAELGEAGYGRQPALISKPCIGHGKAAGSLPPAVNHPEMQKAPAGPGPSSHTAWGSALPPPRDREAWGGQTSAAATS